MAIIDGADKFADEVQQEQHEVHLPAESRKKREAANAKVTRSRTRD